MMSLPSFRRLHAAPCVHSEIRRTDTMHSCCPLHLRGEQDVGTRKRQRLRGRYVTCKLHVRGPRSESHLILRRPSRSVPQHMLGHTWWPHPGSIPPTDDTDRRNRHGHRTTERPRPISGNRSEIDFRRPNITLNICRCGPVYTLCRH